jgi:hypothetical protein
LSFRPFDKAQDKLAFGQAGIQRFYSTCFVVLFTQRVKVV